MAQASESPAVTVTSLLAGNPATTAEICDAFSALLRDWTTRSGKWLAAGGKAVNDPYKASKYVSSVEWVDADVSAQFGDALSAVARDALNDVSGGQAGLLPSLDPYITESFSACGLTSDLTQLQTQVNAASSLAEELNLAAETAPWYPRGYFEISEGLAGKWIDNAPVDCFSRCWYYTLDVIAEDGCSDGIYAEVSIDQNGTAVDWTNDSLSRLRPGQKGRLQFITYSSDARGGDASLADVNCRNY